MPEVDGTCEYVLDPDDPDTWGGEEGDECHVRDEVLNKDGVWTCPHDAEEGKNQCIFHQSIDEKSDEVVVDASLLRRLAKNISCEAVYGSVNRCAS